MSPLEAKQHKIHLYFHHAPPSSFPTTNKLVSISLHKDESTPLHSDQSKEARFFFLHDSKGPAIIYFVQILRSLVVRGVQVLG